MTVFYNYYPYAYSAKMIFYSRKHKKNKTHILQTNNSISMLQTSANSCQSNTNVHKNKYFNSPKKVNLRLAPTQLHFNKSSSHNMTTFMNISKPPTPSPYLRRNAPMSQIKKRTVKKMNIPGLSCDHLSTTLLIGRCCYHQLVPV